MSSISQTCQTSSLSRLNTCLSPTSSPSAMSVSPQSSVRSLSQSPAPIQSQSQFSQQQVLLQPLPVPQSQVSQQQVFQQPPALQSPNYSPIMSSQVYSPHLPPPSFQALPPHQVSTRLEPPPASQGNQLNFAQLNQTPPNSGFPSYNPLCPPPRRATNFTPALDNFTTDTMPDHIVVSRKRSGTPVYSVKAKLPRNSTEKRIYIYTANHPITGVPPHSNCYLLQSQNNIYHF